MINYKTLKTIYIINIEDFKKLLKKIKKSNINFTFFENKLQNYVDNYLQVVIIYINYKLYILNIISIIKQDDHYGIILFKRFLDLLNKHGKKIIMFNINQIELLDNFIIKYNIRNIKKQKKKNYIFLNINPENYIKKSKYIDNYYINIISLLYNTYFYFKISRKPIIY